MITFKSFYLARWLVLTCLLGASVPGFADGPFKLFPVTPCRAVDTRNPNGLNAGPAVVANQTRKFRLQGNCGVPVGAKAVSLNVTVVGPSEAGWLGVYPATGFSGTSTINFNSGEFAIANGALVPVSPVSLTTDMDVSVYWGNFTPNAAQTHVIFDVTGYFQ